MIKDIFLNDPYEIEELLTIYGFPPVLSKWGTPLSGFEWVLAYGLNTNGLYLYGKSGVGKSVMAALICRRWLQKWVDSDEVNQRFLENEWRFVSCAKLVMEIQDSWRTEDESACRILKRYAETPQLVMDDLGAEKPTDFVRQSIYFLINEREQWGRRTIITSNLPLARLAGQYDARIASRINGMCDVREVSGSDRRMRDARS